jgi:hypothetical protein
MPDALNIAAMGHLANRIGPLILVAFFVLSSVFNSDIKGLLFVGLLLVNCFITVAVGNVLPEFVPPEASRGACYGFTLTSNGPLSRLPLSFNVYMFTFFYMVYIIGKYGQAGSNVALLFFFPIVILYHGWWLVFKQGCSSFGYVLISGAIGTILGVLFSYAVDSSGIVELQYFNGIKRQDVCSRPSKQQFKCTSRKNV